MLPDGTKAVAPWMLPSSARSSRPTRLPWARWPSGCSMCCGHAARHRRIRLPQVERAHQQRRRGGCLLSLLGYPTGPNARSRSFARICPRSANCARSGHWAPQNVRRSCPRNQDQALLGVRGWAEIDDRPPNLVKPSIDARPSRRFSVSSTHRFRDTKGNQTPLTCSASLATISRVDARQPR
jgi:hypothetical protein